MRKVVLILLFVVLFMSTLTFADNAATPTTATPTAVTPVVATPTAVTEIPTITVASTTILSYIEKKIKLQKELSALDIQIQQLFSKQFEELTNISKGYTKLNNEFELLKENYTKSFNNLKTSFDTLSKNTTKSMNTLNAKLEALDKNYSESIQGLKSDYSDLSAKVDSLDSAIKKTNSNLFLYVAIGTGAAIVVSLLLKFLIP